MSPERDRPADLDVESELRSLLQGVARPTRTAPCTKAVLAIRDAASSGTPVARRITDEVERFHRLCLAPHWPAIEERMEADISCRTGILARHGLAGALSLLHPTVTYRDRTMRIADEAHLNADCDQEVTLVPSTLADRCFLSIDLHREGGLVLIYPAIKPGSGDSSSGGCAGGGSGAGRGHGGPQRGGAELLGHVLGHTRLLLLRNLGRPRTTTALASDHRLSPSTVSYHLTRLHRAGLLTRIRDGASVRYQRTAEAERLLRPVTAG
ncbi:helix-turn-helix domain-containing protein [Streptomyces sp. NPDC020742]|uniref:helix-turn-helix domain-containing protein n=1 Tax=Streptomyces sp. NPDC020742 TaxID=3154897 RepID=UPI0033CF6698